MALTKRSKASVKAPYLKSDDKKELEDSILRSYTAREETIRQLKEVIQEMKYARRLSVAFQVGGGIASLVGSFITIYFGVSAASGSDRERAGNLARIGVGADLLGSGSKSVGRIFDNRKNKQSLEKLGRILQKDIDANEDLLAMLHSFKIETLGQQPLLKKLILFIQRNLPGLQQFYSGNMNYNTLFDFILSSTSQKVNRSTILNGGLKMAAGKIAGAASENYHSTLRKSSDEGSVYGAATITVGTVSALLDCHQIYQDLTEEKLVDCLQDIANEAEKRLRPLIMPNDHIYLE